MGRKRRDGNHSPQTNNSIQNSVGNEENGYPVPDLKKASDPHKKSSKKKSLRNSCRSFRNSQPENVQDALKKFQDTKNKEH
jgi:hypothetical protein